MYLLYFFYAQNFNLLAKILNSSPKKKFILRELIRQIQTQKQKTIKLLKIFKKIIILAQIKYSIFPFSE